MTRSKDQERELLRKAAEGAGPLIARLRQRRSDIDVRLARLESLVAAYNESIGKRARRTDEPDVASTPKMRRGQVRAHINTVLSQGSDFTVPELRKEIFALAGIRYSRPTVYTVLRRGREKGLYEVKDGSRWRLKTG